MCTWFDVAVFFVIFYISPSFALPSDDEVRADKLKLKHTFDKLLHDLVDINQERLNALNRVIDLDKRPVGTGLRSSMEEPDDDPVILLMINRGNNNNNYKDNNNREIDVPSLLYDYLRANDASDVSDSSDEGLRTVPEAYTDGNNDETLETMAMLRGWRGCTKKAVKACRKACKIAGKRVYQDYKYSSSIKKAFKRECKDACREKFHDYRK